MDLTKARFEHVEWIYLTQDIKKWLALVSMINFGFQKEKE
jgi:hypothetical protein